jgi:hypothetical protein
MVVTLPPPDPYEVALLEDPLLEIELDFPVPFELELLELLLPLPELPFAPPPPLLPPLPPPPPPFRRNRDLRFDEGSLIKGTNIEEV